MENNNPATTKLDNENMQMLQSSRVSGTQQELAKSATLCIVCSTRNRALALVPCGHFSVCVQCGHSLAMCPICGTNIKALIRIYD